MKIRHVLIIAGLGITAIVLWSTVAVIDAFDSDDAGTEHPNPTPAEPTRIDDGEPELIPRSTEGPRHPVNLDVPNKPRATAAACAMAVWSWDTVTDNSPADAAARCIPLATQPVRKQLRQRVAGVSAQWNDLAKHDAWISVDLEDAEPAAGDLGYYGRPYSFYIMQTAHTEEGDFEVPGTPQVTFDVVKRDGIWRIGGIRYES